MLYKQTAIAVLIAAMLAAASLFGGYLTLPAFATHDPDAEQISTVTITQEEDESVIIDGIDLAAKKVLSSSAGRITVAVVQDNEILDSDDFTTSALTSMYRDIELTIGALNVTGTFQIVVEYEGSGIVSVSNIRIIEGTDTAGEDDTDDGTGGEDTDGDSDDSDNDSGEQNEEIQNVISSKTVSLGSSETMTVETVEFIAKKVLSSSAGRITVAVVQDNEILDSGSITTSSLSTTYRDFEMDFDGLKVTDDFQVVIMYDGSGVVSANSIVVPGETEPAEDPDTEEPPTTNPPPAGSVQLVVEAVDQSGNKLTGLWVALLNGGNQLSKTGYTGVDATFTLEADKSYIVEMGDFYNDDTQTSYDFQGWVDSENDSTRRSAVPAEFDGNSETFTALYTVTEGAAPPPDDGDDDPTTTPPPTSPAGTVTAYAYRIPSEFWGPTFVSANAEMYFVLYNSTGWIVYSGFFDENGHTITGLNEGETYWISPTDCDECHGDTHDVVFDHWDDGSTERQRPVTNGMSVGAYYAYDPDL